MSLAILIKSLESDLSRALPRSTQSFAETRARRAELTPFGTVTDLRCALDPSSSLSTSARRAIIPVLVEEAQRGTAQLWSSLLVVSFAPMLHRLRARIGQRFDDDLDSCILVAFLSAVRTVRVGPCTSLALRWATEKAVLTGRINEGRLGPMAPFDEDIHSKPVFHESEEARTFDEVVRSLEEQGVLEILDVLIATRARDESLRAYVARTCPDKRDRAARYDQLCRARLRFERELRDRMPNAAA